MSLRITDRTSKKSAFICRFVLLVAIVIGFSARGDSQTVVRLALDKTTLRPGESLTAAPVLVSGTLPSRDFSLTPSPNVGTVLRVSPSAFRYTAPASIPATTILTLTLRIGGLASPVTADLKLEAPAPIAPPPPTTTLSVLPSSISLNAGSSLSLIALANGVSTNAVTWQLSSPVGTISANGLYQAPTTLTSPVIVQAIARWNNNTAIAASASITVNPVVSISLTPSAFSIQAGQTAQFVADVKGTMNTGVIWRLSPNLGSIINGLYQAPNNISSPASVLVTATSIADPNRVASSTVQIAPQATQTVNPIVLPVEVYGPNGTIKTVTFNLNSTQASAVRKLFLQIHDLDYVGEASIQINEQAWIPLNETNYKLNTLEASYGGIGGGFSTVQGRVQIGLGWFRLGTNTIRFRFNQTDGFTHGFRVLNFELEDFSGSKLLPVGTFVHDDPATWTPPLPDPISIAQGKFLWYNASLSTPRMASIRARCSDCHAQDGRDLKYFNYSNYSIRTRAQFHGLSEVQGNQIASYIRSLNVPSPGRPWNPPYQPGPGLDSRPVTEWSAGAGLTAVLDRDRDILSHLFPNGYEPSRIMPSADLSAREAPVALQLPDWNQWLPEMHPKDALPGFEQSDWNKAYLRIRSGLVPGQVSTLLSLRYEIALWPVRAATFLAPLLPGGGYGTWTGDLVRAHYSARLWQMTKRWELAQEFRLEEMSRSWFGAQADDRAWIGEDAFLASPNMIKIPRDSLDFKNGRQSTHRYFSLIWYHMQLILNNSNKKQSGTSPIDWGYVYGMIKDLDAYSPQAGLLMLWMAKALQVSENGIGPEVVPGGFLWEVPNATVLAHFSFQKSYRELSIAERNAAVSQLAKQWLLKVSSFSPEQWYGGGQTSRSAIPMNNPPMYDGNFPSRVRWMVDTFRSWNIDPSLVNGILDWARTVWPTVSWN